MPPEHQLEHQPEHQSANPADPTAADAAQARQALRQLLGNLSAAAAHLAETLCAPLPDDPAAAAQACAAKPRLAAALDRVGHGLRMTVMLMERPAAAAATHAARAQRHVAARQRIIRDVEDAIQREEHGERAESMEYEVLERIHAEGFEAELDRTPLPQLVTDITHDLGLGRLPGNHPWKRRTPKDVADIEFWASLAGAAEFATHPPRAPGWLPATDPPPD